MSFTNPLFLWSLLAVSIPLIIHLINFKRYRTVYFSNTRFLDNVKRETRSHTRLKQLLIMFARMLIIAALVMAFAGPYIPYGADNQAVTDVKIVYVDNSFSMENETQSGGLFNTAVQIAKELVFNSSASTDYVLITNDMLPQHQMITNRDVFLQNLDKVDISPATADIGKVFIKANTLIPNDLHAELYIISDMQKSMFDVGQIPKLNDNISVSFLPLNALKINNIYIDTCYFASPVHRKGMQERLVATVHNDADDDFTDIPLQLFINDSLKAMTAFNIHAREHIDVELNYTNTISGSMNARLEIADFPITYDNTLYFNYLVEAKSNVLLLTGSVVNRYLSVLYSADSENFVTNEVGMGDTRRHTFSDFDVVVLSNVDEVSSGLASQLHDFAIDGGTVVFIPATELNISSCNNFLQLFNAGSFTAQKIVGSKIQSIEYQHDIFKNVFLKREKQADFPLAGLVWRQVLYNTSSLSSLVSLPDNVPLLSGGDCGRGRIYVLAAPGCPQNDDFYKSPVFVAAFYNIGLSSQVNNPPYAVIRSGSSVAVGRNTHPENNAGLIRISDGQQVDVTTSGRNVGNMLFVALPEAVTKAGMYHVICDNDTLGITALNYNRSESTFAFLTHDDIDKFITENLHNRGRIFALDDENFASVLQNSDTGKPLWQLFVALAMLFVLCEICFIKFIP